MKTTQRGFTLIELLIVVVVIGILAAIAIPKFSATREKAFIAAIKADLRNLASLQELYYNENYTFTMDLDAVGFTGSEGVLITPVVGNNAGWSATGTHSGLPGQSCALYHGNAPQVAPAIVESRVGCTM